MPPTHSSPISLWRDDAIRPLAPGGVCARVSRANALEEQLPSEEDWRSACQAGAILVRSGWRTSRDDPPAWLASGWQRWRRFAQAVSGRAREEGIACVVHPLAGDVLSDISSLRVFLASASGEWGVLLDPCGLLDESMRMHAEEHIGRIFHALDTLPGLWGVRLHAQDPAEELVVRAIKASVPRASVVLSAESEAALDVLLRTLTG